MSGQHDELFEISQRIREELREFDNALSAAQDQLFALSNARRLIGEQAQRLNYCAHKQGLVVSLSCPDDETDSH
jgi:hypothetical protein